MINRLMKIMAIKCSI